MNVNDLSDLSDQITDEEIKATERGRRYKKPYSIEKLPQLPPMTPKMKKMNERLKKEHVSFDICERSKVSNNEVKPPSRAILQRIKASNRKKTTEPVVCDNIIPVYPVFSSHEIFDIGEV